MHEKGVNLTVALELCVPGKVGCTNISRTRCLSSTYIVLVQYIAGCSCVSASVCTLQREKNMQRSLYIRLQNISIWRPLSVHDANILLYMLRSWKRCNDCACPHWVPDAELVRCRLVSSSEAAEQRQTGTRRNPLARGWTAGPPVWSHTSMSGWMRYGSKPGERGQARGKSDGRTEGPDGPVTRAARESHGLGGAADFVVSHRTGLRFPGKGERGIY